MVHWVYVIKSSDTGAIYVGETMRLYRRWNEHMTGKGGATTSQDDYDTLIGLYHVGHNWQFLQYRPEMLSGKYNHRCAYYWDEERGKTEACEVENHITEQYRVGKENTTSWRNVRGGKYCRDGCVFDLSNVTIDRPRCKCGYPCEIKLKNDKTKLYFVCPVPNRITFDGIDIPQQCSFWEEFKPYRELRDADITEYRAKRRAEERANFVRQCDALTAQDFTTSSPAPV